MTKLPYASMMELRRAIRENRKISFNYGGNRYSVEPRDVVPAPRTGAFELLAWVDEPPDGSPPGWRRFKYSFIRGMERLRGNCPLRPFALKISKVPVEAARQGALRGG